jgi:hypothetical protein
MLLRILWLSLAGVAAAVPAAQPGLKVVTREIWPHGAVDTTAYVQPDRSRTEFTADGHETIRITRCDRAQDVVLDVGSRTYFSSSLDFSPSPLLRLAAFFAPRRSSPQGPPTRLIETATTQTDERKPAFGHVARRVITTRREVPLNGASAPAAEIRTDGWYIDVETRPSCERLDERHAFLLLSATPVGGRPKVPVVTFKDIGAPERGFSIELTTTWRSGTSGDAETQVSHKVVTQFSRMPLDAGLFEIPRGFRPAAGPIAAFAANCARTWQMLKAVLFD